MRRKKIFSKALQKLKKIKLPQAPLTLLSSCHHPSSPSFAADRAATLSDIDRFLADNFRSLYLQDKPQQNLSSPSSPPLHSIRSSDRFFASPASSSSLIDERPSSAAVMAVSTDPYMDFLRSMSEVVEGRGRVDWEFMEEMLFCYLEINERSAHGFILRAFADVAVEFGDRIVDCCGGGGEERVKVDGRVGRKKAAAATMKFYGGRRRSG